ncbi:hypothetical protein CHS0354_035701 [Potamilus streckersoni]|uniref:Uncharacterized protein n=1 Tax=Potamilus streckersoni TaxID=2493646 RepID=A0AAE0WAS4_9BIVA|nr:hypothetical protein CHS0354_035701 [Potamilus streckersoni]
MFFPLLGSDVCQNERIHYQAGKLILIVNVTAEEVSNVHGLCCKQVTFLEAKNVSIRVPTLLLNTVSIQIFQNYNYGIKSSIVQDIISLQEGTCPDGCDTHSLSIHPLHEGDDVFISSSSVCLVFINLERTGLSFLYSKGTKATVVALVDPKQCNEKVNEKNNEKIACKYKFHPIHQFRNGGIPTRAFTSTSSKQSSDVTPPLMPSTKFILTISASVLWTKSNNNENTMATESPKETYTAVRDGRDNDVQHLDSTVFLTKTQAQARHYLRRKSVTDVVPAQQSVFVTRSNYVGTNVLHENWSKCNLVQQSSQMSPSAEIVLSPLQMTVETASTNSTNWSFTSQDDDEERTIYENPDNLITRHHTGHSFNSNQSSLKAERIHEYDTQSCCDAHENKE